MLSLQEDVVTSFDVVTSRRKLTAVIKAKTRVAS